jgi:hypothetical protein
MDVSCQTRLSLKEKQTFSSSGVHDSRPQKSQTTANEHYELEEGYESKLTKRLNPKSKNDILRLRSELELWSNDRRRSIEKNNQYSLIQKREKRKQLLENELKIRSKISSLGKKVMENEKADDLEKYFATLTSPKWWNLSDGSVIHVETTKSQVITQSIELYRLLAAYEKHTTKERIDLLYEVQSKLGEFPTSTSKDIVELLKREIDSLTRNITSGLRGLRQRMLHLFIKMLDDIQCNY